MPRASPVAQTAPLPKILGCSFDRSYQRRCRRRRRADSAPAGGRGPSCCCCCCGWPGPDSVDACGRASPSTSLISISDSIALDRMLSGAVAMPFGRNNFQTGPFLDLRPCSDEEVKGTLKIVQWNCVMILMTQVINNTQVPNGTKVFFSQSCNSLFYSFKACGFMKEVRSDVAGQIKANSNKFILNFFEFINSFHFCRHCCYTAIFD